MKGIDTLLVANRGEIARRVFRTCAELGIATVAVASDADAAAPHAREADAVVRLPGSSAAETYLRGEDLVRAALAAGADAVHPGYGFLSENAGFARAVLAAGLTWVGPPPEAIASMGSKVNARALMADAGVPVLAELDPDTLTGDELPVLVKASAGGGGRGMRVVHTLAELADRVAEARSEAASAFGDPTVFCERYLPSGHHVEVQILADCFGGVRAMGERECSIQRRHQKVLEEAPSPLVERNPGMRDALFAAAVAAAKTVGYAGAGTVEFLATDDGEFFFLEMNTRLQVEHPVTECVTGIDLVAEQIRIAEGGRVAAGPPAARGHAVEARLYAEDPAADYRPSAGTLHRLAVPGVTAEFTLPDGDTALRLDSGVADGDEVGVHYDPMLAKVIAYAPDRDSAVRRLAGALAGTRVHGLVTNRDLLVNVLRHPAFRSGDTDTAFLTTHGLDTLAASRGSGRVAALAAALADAAANRTAAPVLSRLPGGWRSVVSQPQRKTYRHGETEHEVAYRFTRDGVHLPEDPDIVAVDVAEGHVVLEIDGVRTRFDVARYGETVEVDAPSGSATVHRVAKLPDPRRQVAPGSLLAPMPAAVSRVAVAGGERVRAGQPLLWLEAMKMEHRVDAPTDGVVAELRVEAGSHVGAGDVLAIVTEEDQ